MYISTKLIRPYLNLNIEKDIIRPKKGVTNYNSTAIGERDEVTMISFQLLLGIKAIKSIFGIVMSIVFMQCDSTPTGGMNTIKKYSHIFQNEILIINLIQGKG